jgi:hypothetical protein
MNVQYAVKNGEVYLIEVNRAPVARCRSRKAIIAHRQDRCPSDGRELLANFIRSIVTSIISRSRNRYSPSHASRGPIRLSPK